MEHPARRSKSGQSHHSRSNNPRGGSKMSRHIKWAYRLALTAVFVSVGGRVAAQTPEGTVIHNTATATYTDLNSNTYAAVSGSDTLNIRVSTRIQGADHKQPPTPVLTSLLVRVSIRGANIRNGPVSMQLAANLRNRLLMHET